MRRRWPKWSRKGRWSSSGSEPFRLRTRPGRWSARSPTSFEPTKSAVADVLEARICPSGATGFAAHEDLNGTGLEAEQQPDAAFQVLSLDLRPIQLLARSLMCRDELCLMVSTIAGPESRAKHHCGTNDHRSGC